MVLALTGVFIAVVALVGGRLAAQGDISLGELVSAVGLALFLLGPLSEFSWVNSELAQGRASAARIAEVLAADRGGAPGRRTTAAAPSTAGSVCAASPTARCKDLDLDIAPGDIVGVVAPDPADATALLRCLARRADPDHGTVELDGVPLTDLDPADIRTAILVAEHDADLFEGTLIANVSAAAPARVRHRAGDSPRRVPTRSPGRCPRAATRW